MEKLTIKNLIEFRRRQEKNRKGYLNSLENKERKSKENKEEKQKGGGGDYWISCLSTLENVFKENKKNLIQEKINELQIKFNLEDRPQFKNGYLANINILNGFGDFDFEEIRPLEEITILHQHKDKEILDLNSLPIKANPSIIFSFKKDDFTEIGAISFIAQKGGFKNSELGIFTETYYRYLEYNFSKDYKINTKFIIAVDAVDIKIIRYSDILKGDLLPLLEAIIEDIKTLL